MFNKTPADELQREIGKIAIVSTLHALAYSYVVKEYGLSRNITSSLNWRDIPRSVARPFGTDHITLEHIEEFCISPYLTVDDYFANTEDPVNIRIQRTARQLLNLMAKGYMRITHSFYLKFFHTKVMSGEVKLKPVDLLIADECLSGDSKVKLENGTTMSMKSLFSIKETNKALPKVKSFNELTEQYEFKQVTNAMYMGDKQTYSVRTEGLNKVICTDNHKLLTQRGWVEVKDIVIGQDYTILDNTHNQKCKYILSDKQLQLVLGSYLGDGGLSKQSKFNTYRMNITHGIAQETYLLEKLKAFPNMKVNTIKSGYTGKWSIKQSGPTPTFILNGPPFDLVLSEAGPEALAVWLMDDGSCVNPAGSIKIHSNSFTKEQNLLLIKMFETRFGISPVLRKSREFYELNFLTKEAAKLRLLLAKFIHPLFKAKFGIVDTEYTVDWTSDYKAFGGNFISSIKPHSVQPTYDITVEDNHNFVTTRTGYETTGVVVHNCQDMSPITLDIFAKIPAKHRVLVGDNSQMIYHFLNLEDGFLRYPHAKQLTLSKSFRVSVVYSGAIQQFLRKHLQNEEYVFEGMDYEGKQEIVTKAYLTRTNSALIGKMIELNKSNIPYKLSSTAKLAGLFKLPLALCYAKPGFAQKDPELIHLQEDINTWGKLPEHSRGGKFKFLLEANPGDSNLKRAITLISKFSPEDIIAANDKAKLHKKAIANLTVATSFSVKGSTFDAVELDDDIDESIEGFINIPKEEIMPEERAMLANYFVSCTRMRFSLKNAKYLDQLMEKL